MKYTQNEKLFKTVSTHIAGRWYNFATDEILVFSPAEAPLDVNDLLLIKEGVVHSDHYLLGLCAADEIYVVIGDNKGVSKATIKVLTTDTLILQKPNCNMVIYERRNNTHFADELIAGL